MNKSIWLFGGGGAASWLLGSLLREGITVCGLLDDNASGKKMGIPILSPNSEFITKEDKKNSTVIMAVLNPLVNTSIINERLKNDGWGRVLDFGKWSEEVYLETGKCIAPILKLELLGKEQELEQVRSLLSDDISIKVFDSFLEFVRTGKDTFGDITIDPYFPKDIPEFQNPLRMIDCGAFTGDTILQAQKLGYVIESVHAFDPDPINYETLSKVGRDLNGIVSWPCGVGDKTETIRFQTQGDMGSFADPNGNTLVQCVSLDDCIPSYNPNFIKMDIEGHEFNALKGAENIIRKHRPRLAISVYHLSSDIWKIPLWIREVYGESAKFYLRHHSRTIADTVLYVLP
jgi:FkbM family methyltransferase